MKLKFNHFSALCDARRLHRLSIFLLCVSLLAGCVPPQSTPEKYRLKFNTNGKFKIAQFTDMHLKHGDPTMARTLETVKMILEAEKPDVAVLTGDIVWNVPDREPWTVVIKLFEDAKIPFAVVFGNHDGEAATKISRSEIVDILTQSPYYIGEKGPEDIHGKGNYVVPVYGNNNRVAALLYCFDSNVDSSNPRLSGYQPIYFDQIAWYRQQSKKFTAENDGKPLPAFAFFHIPLPEYGQVAARLFPDVPRFGSPGPSYNSGLFGSFLEMEDVMGVFVGHIHGNDYVGLEKYIALGYGRVTGWGAGANLERGARIIEMVEGEFMYDSWIRTAKGIEQTFNYPTGISSTDEETMTYLPAQNVKPTKQGVAYTYYEGQFGSVRNIDPAKKVSEGVMKNISILDAPAKDYFAYEFRTLIQIPERGVYKFYSISDDDSQIYLDGQLVVNKPGSAVGRFENKVALDAGYHELKVLFYEANWGEYLEVGYSSKKIRDQILPDNILFVPE